MVIKILKKIIKKIIYLFDEAKPLFTTKKGRWTYWYKNIHPFLIDEKASSKLPINVIIPAAEKDAEILLYCIDGIRRNIKHPISKIIIISSNTEKILNICTEAGCEFVDENTVTDLSPESINLFIQGTDRSRWIFQQFLKLNSDKLSSDEHFLIVDADTVFIRPQVFEFNEKMIFNFSDEYHQPYFDIYKTLFNEVVTCPVSFTSHQMLLKKSILRELKTKIEDTNHCNWQQAILNNINRNEFSAHSDYDTYGQFVFAHHRQDVAVHYWFNASIKRENLQKVPNLEVKYGKKFKSISFHSYNK